MNEAVKTIGRWAAVAAMAAVVVAGSAGDASAADAVKRPDFGSKAAMKTECAVIDGVFKEDSHGNLECHYPDAGGYVECDGNGNDCWWIPPERRAPGGWESPAPGGVATQGGWSTGGIFVNQGGWSGGIFASLTAAGDPNGQAAEANPAAAPTADEGKPAKDDGKPAADRDEKPDKAKHKKGEAKGKQRGKAGRR